MTEETRDELGYHVIGGTLFLAALRRVEAGEKADDVYWEMYANASEREDYREHDEDE